MKSYLTINNIEKLRDGLRYSCPELGVCYFLKYRKTTPNHYIFTFYEWEAARCNISINRKSWHLLLEYDKGMDRLCILDENDVNNPQIFIRIVVSYLQGLVVDNDTDE